MRQRDSYSDCYTDHEKHKEKWRDQSYRAVGKITKCRYLINERRISFGMREFA